MVNPEKEKERPISDIIYGMVDKYDFGFEEDKELKPGTGDKFKTESLISLLLDSIASERIVKTDELIEHFKKDGRFDQILTEDKLSDEKLNSLIGDIKEELRKRGFENLD